MSGVFDTQQWTWTRMYERRTFCGMSNAVQIYRNDGRSDQIRAAVPAEFIQYLTDIHGSGVDLTKVSLYAELHGKLWFFGYELRDGAEPIDLWTYRSNGLPPWLDPEVAHA